MHPSAPLDDPRQVSRLSISSLPTELLSEVFLYIVESGIQEDGMCFRPGTFRFREVCRHWDDVAVGCPQLWVWWLTGAAKVWNLFNERSKDALIFLSWRSNNPPPYCLPGLPVDTTLPGRIRHLDFAGREGHLEDLLRSFDPSSTSNTSSIRFRITRHNGLGTEAHLTRFFSLPFPKLSKLNVKNFLPDPSSPAFTTSNLISLKLSFPQGELPSHTLTQFSRILQRHQDLRELDLEDGAVPLVRGPGVPVSCILSRLVNLKLRGTVECIAGLINLVGMSPTLRAVALRFCEFHDSAIPALVDTVKTTIAMYYERGGLDHPLRAHHLSVTRVYSEHRKFVRFVAEPHSTTPPTERPILSFEFWRVDELLELLLHFPLNDVREFIVIGLDLPFGWYRAMLQRMLNLSHLHLAVLKIKPVLKAMDSCEDAESSRRIIPKLAAMTLRNVDLLQNADIDLLLILQDRRDENIGLEQLVFESCCVHRVEKDFEEVVKEVKWVDVQEMGSGFGASDPDMD